MSDLPSFAPVRDTGADRLRAAAEFIAAAARDLADEAVRERDQFGFQLDALKARLLELAPPIDEAAAADCALDEAGAPRMDVCGALALADRVRWVSQAATRAHRDLEARNTQLEARNKELKAENERLRTDLAARPSSLSSASATAPTARVAPALTASTAAAASRSASPDTRPHLATRRDAHGRRFWDGDGWRGDPVTAWDLAPLDKETLERLKPRGSRLVAIEDIDALILEDARKDANKSAAAREKAAEHELEQLSARGGGDLEDQIDAALDGVGP